jgi:hypothetical protein
MVSRLSHAKNAKVAKAVPPSPRHQAGTGRNTHLRRRAVPVKAKPASISAQLAGSARDQREGVEISIIDHGVGFDMAAPTRGHGFANMKARATALHSEFSYDSRAGGGTHLVFWFPVDQALEGVTA